MNKKLFVIGIILILLLVVLTTLNLALAQEPSRKLLVSLQPGEKLMVAESYIGVSMSEGELFLVTFVNGKYFTYEKGQRKGPFDKLEDLDLKSLPKSKKSSTQCSAYEVSEISNIADYLITNQDGTFNLKVGSKSYGPYTNVVNLHVWPDKSGFVAIVLDREMKSTLVTSEGLSVPLNGDVETIHFSPVSKKFVFALKERQEMDPNLLNTDFSKMSQEELLKFAQKMEEKSKSAGPMQAYVYVNGTTKLGPYDINSFFSTNPTFTTSSGDNWIMTVNDALYVNGTKVKDYPNSGINPCQVWLSRDGKKHVFLNYSKLTFGDGKSYNYPLDFETYESAGKNYIKWISLENNKDLVLYSREI